MVILPGKPAACDRDWEVAIVSSGAVPESCLCSNQTGCWKSSGPVALSSGHPWPLFQWPELPEFWKRYGAWLQANQVRMGKVEKAEPRIFQKLPIPRSSQPLETALPLSIPVKWKLCKSNHTVCVSLAGWFLSAHLSSQLIRVVAGIRIPAPLRLNNIPWHVYPSFCVSIHPPWTRGLLSHLLFPSTNSHLGPTKSLPTGTELSSGHSYYSWRHRRNRTNYNQSTGDLPKALKLENTINSRTLSNVLIFSTEGRNRIKNKNQALLD